MKNSHKIIVLLAFAATGAFFFNRSTPEQKEAKYLKLGNEFFAKNDYGKARLEYLNAAKYIPTDPELLYRMGLVDEAVGDINSAYSDFSRAEMQNAHFDPALEKLAGYYLLGEHYDDAQKRVDTLLKDEPDNLQAHAINGALLLHGKDLAGAEKEARMVLAKDPGNTTAIAVLTGFYFAKHDEAMAGKTLEDGITRNPRDMSLLMLKAKLYAESNNLEKIDEAYHAMFKLSPDDGQLRIDLADIYIEAKQYDKAEATLRAAMAALPQDWKIKQKLVAFLEAHRGVDVAEKQIKDFMQAYPQNNDLYFWLVELYTHNNAVDKAVALLEQMIARQPVGEQALNARTDLARIQYIKGDRQLAEKIVKEVLAKDPGNQAAQLIDANMTLDEGRYNDAVTSLRSIIHAQPKNKEALELLSEALLHQGHVDLAIDTLSQAMEIDPLDPAVRVRLAQMYNINGDSSRALELLAAVNKQDPRYAVGWESTARVAISSKDLPKAKSAISTLSSMEGQQMTSVFLEGQVQANTGKNEEAIASYDKVIHGAPDSPLAEHAVSALADTYQSMGQLDKAAQYIEGLKSNSPYVNDVLGKCYLALGKNDMAAAAFDKAIAANATFQEPYIERAKLYVKAHADDQATGVLKKAISAVPGNVTAPMMEAYILQKNGHYKDAIDIYSGIIKNNPEMSVAANNLAAVISDYEYKDPAMLEKARKLAEQFIGSPNPLLLDTLGWVYYREGKIDQALTLMNQAKASGVKITPEVHYHYGAILLKSGQKEAAKAELQQAVTPQADYHGLEDAKKMLQGL